MHRRCLTVLVLLVLGVPSLGALAATVYPAEAVKAVFLYRFAGYVQWPPPLGDAPRFTIAVLDAPAVAAQLAQLLPDHPILGKPGVVHAIRRINDLGDAQMLYVGTDYDGDLRALLEGLQGRPVLVVTDRPGGLEAGSTVNFVIDQQHVRFEVSMPAARRAGLKISSDLLAVAAHVETGQLVPVPVLCRPLDAHSVNCFLHVADRRTMLR